MASKIDSLWESLSCMPHIRIEKKKKIPFPFQLAKKNVKKKSFDFILLYFVFFNFFSGPLLLCYIHGSDVQKW